MLGKVKKYIKYVQRFAESPRKGHVLKELIREVREKGPVTGVKSLLHIKSGNYVPDVTREEFIGTQELAKDYRDRPTITLPDPAIPLVSIIVPMYNQLDYTYSCVRSIFENNRGIDYEIIVADDLSPEDSAPLASQFINLKLVRNAENLGFLRNCNHAASYARGKYLVFLNNDTQVMKGWLAELLYIFDHYKDAGLVGSKLIYPNGALQEAGGVIWKDGSAMNFGNRDNPAKSAYNYVKEADYISGASIMIPTALWQKIGGFDERYAPAYCEDSDLCFAVRKAGFKVYYQPFSEVVHFEGITHGRDVKQGIKQYQVKNKKKFVEKWAPELAHQHAKGKTIFYDRDRSHQNKHILVIDHNVPTIDKDAGSRTINNFVDCLLDLGYRVKFMVPNMYPSASYMKLLQLKGVEVLHGEDYIAWKSGWKHYLIDNKAHFDAILLSRSSICIPILKFLRHIHYPGKVIYYGHDLGFRRIAEEAEVLGDNSLRKLAAKLKGDEDFMYQNSDTALMINYDEINYLKKYINKPVHYIPPYFFEETSDTPGFQERSGLLFVGGFGHPPNHEAVKWFMEDIYPALAEKQIPFTVAGANIPQFIIDYKATFPLFNTKSDLSVAELDAAYRAARLAVVPLKFGAGVKGKVIEAMAKGVPVVGTDKAFEGLMKDDQFPYKDCNKAEEMTRETELIYNNEQQWNTISNYGKNYIAHKFNRESMRQVFVDILN